MRIRSTIVAVLLACLAGDVPLAMGEDARPLPAEGADKTPLAVVPFQVLGEVGVKDAGAILAERLMPLLADKYQIVDQAQLKQFQDQDALTMADLVALGEGASPEQRRARALRLRAVRILVVGTLSAAPDGLAITARLSDWQSGKVSRIAFVRAADWDSLMDRLPYVAAKLTGAPLVHRPGLPPLGELEFRIVPGPPGSGQQPVVSDADVQAMRRRLAEDAYAARPMDQYVWAELGTDGHAMVTGEYRGRKGVLLCNHKGGMMVFEAQAPAWGIQRADVGVDETGRPYLGIRLDERGAKLLGPLTRANVGNRMALLIDGKVLSAPVIRSEIAANAMVSGNFTLKEAQSLAAAINRTMRPAAPKGEK